MKRYQGELDAALESAGAQHRGPGYRAGGLERETDRDLTEAEARVTELAAKEEGLRRKMQAITVKNQVAGSDALKIKFAESDAASAEEVLKQVKANLKQLLYEAKVSVARVRLDYPATPSNRPRSNHRIKVMAVSPFVVGCGVLALLAMLELLGPRHRSGRVFDAPPFASARRRPLLAASPARDRTVAGPRRVAGAAPAR